MKVFLNGFMNGLSLVPLWAWIAKPYVKAAIEAEREACAKICRDKSLMVEIQGYKTDDEHDKVALFSLSWQFEILAREIKDREKIIK